MNDSRVILSARIAKDKPLYVVYGVVAREGKERNEGEEIRLFDYFSDELNFVAEEFVGLTVSQAYSRHTFVDSQYLRFSNS
jgi:hypothetical protein